MAVNYQERASGKYYEELEPGTIFKHSITRTVTETDNLLFSALTYNTAWLHLDEEYSKTQMFGQRLVNSNFTLALIASVGVIDVTLGTTKADESDRRRPVMLSHYPLPEVLVAGLSS
jgi:acyl dehydratase